MNQPAQPTDRHTAYLNQGEGVTLERKVFVPLLIADLAEAIDEPNG